MDFKTLRQAFKAEYPDHESSTQQELLIFQLIKATKNEVITVPTLPTVVSSTITVMSPTTGSQVITGIPIEVIAVSQFPRLVSKVEFYANNSKIGEDRNPPYGVLYTPTVAGSLALKAVAISQDGTTSATSADVVVTVVAAATPPAVNIPPTVSLANPGSVTAGQTVALTATASDPDGTISKVEFYQGSTKLGEDTASPYTVNWTPSAGSYVLTAVAFDNLNLSTTSNARNVTVSAASVPIPTITVSAPATANTNNAVTLSATASITGDTITGVQFRVNGVNQGAPDTSSPYSTTWTPTSPGTFTITAVATGALGGSATSAAITVTVTTVAAPTPTVTVTAPKAGLINEAQTLNATASVSSGTISSVQFQVNGANQSSADTSAPYSTSWTPTAKGIFAIRVIATASGGGTATSTAVNVPIFDTKILGGASGAGTSLGAVEADFILFDNNQAAGGNAATMNVFVNGEQVAAFNYGDTAYNGRPFAYFNSANSVMYTGTIAPTVNLS